MGGNWPWAFGALAGWKPSALLSQDLECKVWVNSSVCDFVSLYSKFLLISDFRHSDIEYGSDCR